MVNKRFSGEARALLSHRARKEYTCSYFISKQATHTREYQRVPTQYENLVRDTKCPDLEV